MIPESQYVAHLARRTITRKKPPKHFGYCVICQGYHDKRWHQHDWRRKAYEQDPELIAIYRREPA